MISFRFPSPDLSGQWVSIHLQSQTTVLCQIQQLFCNSEEFRWMEMLATAEFDPLAPVLLNSRVIPSVIGSDLNLIWQYVINLYERSSN